MTQNATSDQPLTPAQARQINWHRKNPRPMGELLDEGFLTKRDLQWAAEHAFNPRQKQAAKVLLDELMRTQDEPSASPKAPSFPPELANTSFALTLTMEQVRATEWPFAPYKGQHMGQLVDKQQLTFKDLGYAVDAAWDQRVRQAAMALLLIRLNQTVHEPAPSAGLLHVVSGGRSFAERRQFLLVFLEAGLLGAIEGVLVFVLIQRLVNALSTQERLLPSNSAITPSLILGAILFLAISMAVIGLIFVCLEWLSKRIGKQIQLYRKGREGEDRVVAAMHAVLDGNWHLIRNIVLPGHKGDLDSVLIGPSGVWVLEIKAFTHEYRNIGEHWEYRINNRWHLHRKSPSRQAAANAARLSNFLKTDGIQQWIKPVVIWANPEAPLHVANPTIPVWTLDHLSDELNNIWQVESLTAPNRERIVDKLTQLCREQQRHD